MGKIFEGVTSFFSSDFGKFVGTVAVAGTSYVLQDRAMDKARKAQAAEMRKLMEEMGRSRQGVQDLSRMVRPAQQVERKTITQRRSRSGSKPRGGLLTSNDGNKTKLGAY